MSNLIFQNYHKHTYWSNIKVADSATSYEEYCQRAVELGHGIISSLEHGWQGHYIECHQLAEKYNLKFLFGTEAYWVKDRFYLDEKGHKDGANCHICLLAMNENGRQAINDILSQSAEEGMESFYRQSRIDLSLIKSLPAEDVVVTSACFLKGNRVLTNNGYVNIEDIKCGDKVVNRYGQLEDVNFPTAIMYNGTGYSISTNAFSSEIKCTADHKYLVINRDEIKKGKTPYWCKAEDICKAQSLSNHMRKFLLYPLNKSFTNKYAISKSEFDGVYKAIINHRCVKQKLPDDITITPELMRFFGAFIGNGYISVFHKNEKIGITFNSKEFKTCYDDFVHPVEQQLGIKFNITRSGNCNKVEISTGSIDVVNLFYWLFGNCKAESKHIPNRLLHISYEFDCELLYGLCISDGGFQKTSGRDYVNESYRMTYCTTSEKLKEDFRSLCCDLGLYSTIHSKKEYTDKRGVFHQPSYYISIISKNLGKIKRGNSVSHSTVVSTIKNLYENTHRSPRATFDGIEYLLLKITSMNEIMVDEEVYCLNNNTHSFVCEFATVHNCAAFWKYEDSDDIVLELKEHFGKNFFLEVQYHNTEAQIRLNRHIKFLKDKYDIQLIMGCDSHYIDEKGKVDREELIKSKRGDEKVEFNKKKESLENDLKRGKITNKEYDSALEELVRKMNEKSDLSDEEGWYMDYPDGETAYQRFADQCVLNHEEILQAINNTNIFIKVEEYDCPIFNHDIKMPSLYGDLTQQERDSKLESLIWDKWSEYKKEVPTERHSEYEEQIRYELDIIKKTFHSDYFLLDYAITQLGKKKGGQLTLTGRGSGVSFFLNKLLGFTSVDRISAKVKMYPERFMSPTRILETHSLADIDMNVARQEPFWEAQEELLGFEHSKQMIAYQQLKPAAAWKMYAKAQNVDYETSNEISKQIAKYLKDYQKAKEDVDDEDEIDIDILDYIGAEYKELYLKSAEYLGVVSAVTPHACASLLYEGNIRKEIGYIFVKSQSNDGRLCCCMDGKWAEKYGFLKNDWLKVNVVEVIYKIFERIGMQPFSSTELIEKCKTDLEPWKLYKQRCTKGLNQVEQPSSSQKVGAYAPTNISELTAFVAAVRPGFKSMYYIFESRKHFDYNIPSFDRLLQTEEMTNSFVLYQEQSMATLNYAGIPMSECYAVIKAISKKRVDEITKNKPIFLKGFKERLQEEEKVSDKRAEEAALQVWRIIEDGASYQFNASHAYSVALDSLYQAWLKAHYPLEFYETYLNILNEKGAKTRLNKFKQEAESYFRIKFPPYRFGQDNRKITIDKENNAINNALSSIKGYSNIVGEALYQCYFENIDFISSLKWLNERSIKAAKVVPLIKIGYFSEFGNCQALLTFMDCFDKLKQGNAKEVAKGSVEKWFEDIISKHSNGLKKDGEPAKAWKILDIDEILEETLDYCINNIEEASYSTRMEWQNDILGYIELTTGKEEDIKKVLVLDATPVVGKFSPDPWCYKVETRSIGTGRTATLNVYTKDYEKYGKLKKYDIIRVGRLEKNKKGYWYMFDYYQIDKGNKSDKINS